MMLTSNTPRSRLAVAVTTAVVAVSALAPAATAGFSLPRAPGYKYYDGKKPCEGLNGALLPDGAERMSTQTINGQTFEITERCDNGKWVPVSRHQKK